MPLRCRVLTVEVLGRPPRARSDVRGTAVADQHLPVRQGEIQRVPLRSRIPEAACRDHTHPTAGGRQGEPPQDGGAS
eukprot:13460033-Alexandrium_andersonii.AAC.1